MQVTAVCAARDDVESQRPTPGPDNNERSYMGDCKACPLYSTSMGLPFESSKDGNTCEFEYRRLIRTGTPVPMMIRITKAIIWLRNQE